MDMPVEATSKKEAASKARQVPGVKKNHPDWCLELPFEITFLEFEELKKNFKKNLY